jgi:hypothetical protein
MHTASMLALTILLPLLLQGMWAWAEPPAPQAPPPAMVEPGVSPPPPPHPDMAPPDMPPPPPPRGEFMRPGGTGAFGRMHYRMGRPDGGGQWQPGGPGRGPQGGPRTGQPNPHMHARLWQSAEWLRTSNPREFDRLQKLRQENPEQFRKEMRKALQDYAKKQHPEQYQQFKKMRKAEERLQKLAKQYQAEQDPAEKAALEQTMRAELEQQFVEKQKMRQKELADLEQRLQQFKTELQGREQNKQQMIDLRMKSLIEGPGAVKW